MLAKKLRLPIQSFVGKKGKMAKTPFFLIKIFVSDLSYSRFGVTVSSKVAAKAVERNRIKRAAYVVLAEIKGRLPVADYWVSVLPAAANLSGEQFLEQLGKLL